MNRPGSTLALAAMLSACAPTAAPPEGAHALSATASPWAEKLGQIVTLEGAAEDAKLGALLVQDRGMIWIDGLDSWPADVRGRRLTVTGKVIERADLPVFVHHPGGIEMQGIPVPEGTDVERASHRFLLTEARWSVVR